MSYRENVEQAAAIWKTAESQESIAASAQERAWAARWEIARLTDESTFDSGDTRSQVDRVSMEKWSADLRGFGVDLRPETARRYKSIWRRFGSLREANRPTWREAWLEANGASNEDYADLRAQSEVKRASPEVKRATFQQLARDPDVIQEAAVLGTPTSRAVSDLYTKTERVREEFRERETEADPISKRLDQVGTAIDLEAACNRFAKDLLAMSERFAREINELLPKAGPAREAHLYWVRQAIERSRSVLNELEGYAETGRTDLDTFLADVLGGR